VRDLGGGIGYCPSPTDGLPARGVLDIAAVDKTEIQSAVAGGFRIRAASAPAAGVKDLRGRALRVPKS